MSDLVSYRCLRDLECTFADLQQFCSGHLTDLPATHLFIFRRLTFYSTRIFFSILLEADSLRLIYYY